MPVGSQCLWLPYAGTTRLYSTWEPGIPGQNDQTPAEPYSRETVRENHNTSADERAFDHESRVSSLRQVSSGRGNARRDAGRWEPSSLGGAEVVRNQTLGLKAGEKMRQINRSCGRSEAGTVL